MDHTLLTAVDLAAEINLRQSTISFVSASVAMVIGCLVIWISRRARVEERWPHDFGVAYALLAAPYIVRLFGQAVDYFGWATPGSTHEPIDLLANIFSAGNSALFCRAGLHLLGRRRFEWYWLFTGFLLAELLVYCLLSSTWTRLPDGIISASCIGLFGYALGSNIGVKRRRRFWAVGAIGFAGLYGIMNLVWSLGPVLIAYEPELEDGLLEVAHARSATLNDGAVKVLDSIVYAAALPLKLLLAVVALYVLLRTLFGVSLGLAADAREEVLFGSSDPLTSLMRTTMDSFHADLVEVCYLLPGDREARVRSVQLRRTDRRHFTSEETPMPSSNHSAVAAALRGDEAIMCRDLDVDPGHPGGDLARAQGIKSRVVVPVWYHNGVIAALSIEWAEANAFGYSVQGRIVATAASLAPIVQSLRELRAVEECSRRLDSMVASNLTSAQVLARCAETVQDILSPSITRLSVRVGFRCKEPTVATRDASTRRSTPPESIEGPSAVTCKMPLLSPSGDFSIGDVMLFCEDCEGGMARTFATSENVRRVVANHVSTALFDCALRQFATIINDTQILFIEAKALSDWFQVVVTAARRAGLVWVVAVISNDERYFEDQAHWQFVKTLGEAPGAPHIHREPGPGTSAVLELRLAGSEARLYFGLARAELGPELTTDTPWKIFLEQIAGMATASLSRLVAVRESQIAHFESTQFQALATVAVTTGTVVHQISNMTAGLSYAARTLVDQSRLGTLQADADTQKIIEGMGTSLKRLTEIVGVLKGVTALSDVRPCDLRQVIKRSLEIFDIALKQREIRIHERVPDSDGPYLADVPLHVAVLALANLIENANEAIGRQGTIRVEVCQTDDALECAVTDTGGGVPETHRERIFDLGFTTKKGSGGWGLFLVRRSMRESGGDVRLTTTSSAGSTFTLVFPKAHERSLT